MNSLRKRPLLRSGAEPVVPPSRGPRFALRYLTMAYAVLAATFAGCATEEAVSDAGPGDRTLQIVTPGRSVGLVPGKHRTLGVRLTAATSGAPVANERIDFAIFGDPQGSTLSADAVLTDGDGMAQATINAGAVAASFIVRVSAASTGDVVFDIEVSAAGFGALLADTSYRGTPPKRVEFLLYAGTTRCASLLSSSKIPDALRQRSSEGGDEPAHFGALALDRGYSLFARGVAEDDVVRTAGCVELPREQLKAEQTARVVVKLEEAHPPLEGPYSLNSSLLLPAASRPLVRALRPWEDLTDCRNDPAQLLLDCIIDAADGDDPLDCVVVAPSAKTQAIIGERGELSGICRQDETSRGTPSLDRRLRERIDSSSALFRLLEQLPLAAADVLRRPTVQSTLILEGSGDEGQLVASHRIDSVTFGAGPSEVTYKAPSTGLYQPLASPIEARARRGRLLLGEHQLNLGYGLVGRRVLGELILEPAGHPGDSSNLIVALAGLVAYDRPGGQPLQGCAAIEALVCSAARLAPGCLGVACTVGLGALAGRLDRGFWELDQPASLLELGGAADLAIGAVPWQVEGLGVEQKPGTWTRARLRFGGEVVDLEEASFTGQPARP